MALNIKPLYPFDHPDPLYRSEDLMANALRTESQIKQEALASGHWNLFAGQKFIPSTPKKEEEEEEILEGEEEDDEIFLKQLDCMI